MTNMNTHGFTVGIVRVAELFEYDWVIFDETFTFDKLSQLVNSHNDGLINLFEIFEFKRVSEYLGKINYSTLGLRRIRPGSEPETKEEIEYAKTLSA